MDLYRISVFAHLLLAVLFVGLALYWLIMLVALRRQYDPQRLAVYLDAARCARWPHVGVPASLRLPLPWMAWLALVGLAGTGIVSSQVVGPPAGPLWWLKIGLVALAILLQVVMTRRVVPVVVRVSFTVAVLLVIVSAWIMR
ncbi:MAG: hypothetical protein EPO25_04910 [Gammaproteobacteria bacterium]|nr:MAG: hypothetical protein EPO25_04910 [Gammaproteobacteria bacterium]